MRIAVVQHRFRPTPAQDLEALVLAASRAAAEGAGLVLLPVVPDLDEGPLADDLWRRLAAEAPNTLVLVPRAGEEAAVAVDDLDGLGRVALLPGDASFDPDTLAQVFAERPDIALLAPGAESELQAQAVLEFAIGLSTSLASVVFIVEPDGAEVGEPGHGGSAIVYLGDVMAEASSGDDVIVADVPLPAGRPEPLGALPEVPLLLAQRFATHRGRKLAVEYPADLG